MAARGVDAQIVQYQVGKDKGSCGKQPSLPLVVLALQHRDPNL
jgi:hypothetical protein